MYLRDKQFLFEIYGIGIGNQSSDPTGPFADDFHGRVASGNSAERSQMIHIEAGMGLGTQSPLKSACRSPCKACSSFSVSDQLSQPEKDVLVACQPLGSSHLKKFCEAVQAIAHRLRAQIVLLPVEAFELTCQVMIKLTMGFEVTLPAIAADCHLHYFRSSFIDSRNARITFDFFHHVFPGIPIATQCLDCGVCGQISRLCGQVFRDGALGIQVGVFTVESFGCSFDIGAACFEQHHMRNDELVRVTLLFGKRGSPLDASHRVWDCPVQRRPSGAKSERGNHQARIAEHQLRLDEALPFLLTEQTVGIDVDAFQRNCRGVAGPNPVLVFRFSVAQSGGILFNDKPAGSSGSFGENGIQVGKSAVADPLLVAGDFVSRD